MPITKDQVSASGIINAELLNRLAAVAEGQARLVKARQVLAEKENALVSVTAARDAAAADVAAIKDEVDQLGTDAFNFTLNGLGVDVT